MKAGIWVAKESGIEYGAESQISRSLLLKLTVHLGVNVGMSVG